MSYRCVSCGRFISNKDVDNKNIVITEPKHWMEYAEGAKYECIHKVCYEKEESIKDDEK